MDNALTISQVQDFPAGLAYELATNLFPAMEVFHRHGYDEEQAKNLLKNSRFRAIVKEAHAHWQSTPNAIERIRAKSAIALEDLLPEIHAIIANKNINPTARLEGAKFLAKVSAAEKAPNEEVAGTGKGFSITINIGQQPKTIEGVASEPDVHATIDA